MKILLDTHAFLWWLEGDQRLSSTSRSLISNDSTTVFLSAASAWEIATKVRIGKLPGAVEVAERLPEIIFQQDFTQLNISIEHARRAGLLPSNHRDPFDRMLLAQSHIEGIGLVSNERLFDQFGIQRIW